MTAYSVHSRRMYASPFFPIRWTPVPVTVTPRPVSSSPSCSHPPQTRRDSYAEPRESARNIFSTTWHNLKHLFSRRSPVHRLELLAESYPYSRSCICLRDLNFSKDTINRSNSSGSLVPGAFCNCCHGSNMEELNTNTTMDISQNTMIGPKKSFERDWKEIRQRLERKIAAAAAQAISGRPGGADNNRKPRWATPPRQKQPRFYEVKNEDKLTTRGANPRTGVISPSNRTDSSGEDSRPRPRASQKWKVCGDQWVSVEVSQTPSPQPSPLSYKLAKTVSSAGSGSSADISSSDDWEDRFVVNMPSATDPNPPAMTVEQIRVYQEKIGKLHTSKRHEMDASKPSSGSPISSQDRITRQPKQTSAIPVPQRGTASQSPSSNSSQSISPPVDGLKQSYFSPDEIGRVRVSPVNDSPKLKQKEMLKRLREECFLGCLGVDEAAAKNPDEILLFPNLDDEAESQVSPIMKSDDEGDKTNSSSIRWSTKLPQSSRHPLGRAPQRRTPQVIPSALTTTAHSTKLPKPTTSEPKSSVQHLAKEGEDNGVTSASDIASTAKKTANRKAAFQGSRARLGFKVSPKLVKLPNKSRNSTPDNDLFFESSSPDTPPDTPPQEVHVHDVLEQPSTSSSPNLDRTGLEWIAEDISTSQSGDSMRLSPNDIFKNIPPSKGPNLYDILSPAEARARNDPFNAHQKAPKTPSVAELDGFQVPQQVPSPPLSTSSSPSSSPPPLLAKTEISPTNEKPRQQEKRNTHTIRMEIRMKAEKARQGAAAAKSASDRLAAARKHAERLAEARSAYDKAKAQRAAKKTTREPMDELSQQRLNTEKINEARKAYKEAKAREEAEKLAEACQNKGKSEFKQPSAPGSASASTSASHHAVPANNTKPARKPTRKSGAKRPSMPHSSNRDTSTARSEEHMKPVNSSNNADLADIALGSGSFYLSLTNFHNFLQHNQVYSHIIFYCANLFHMATHCFKVCRRLAETWLEYKQTGILPQSCVDDFGQLTGDIGQALVNFSVLYFVLMMVVKTAGYVVIVTNWIAWVVKPVGWVFGHVLDTVWV